MKNEVECISRIIFRYGNELKNTIRMMILSRRSSESFIQSRRDVSREVGSRNLTEIKGYKREVS